MVSREIKVESVTEKSVNSGWVNEAFGVSFVATSGKINGSFGLR